ncbi:MAG: DUF1266 domain-containing protein [Verrucomicrobiae bacterium]|nr:DUF1266 domain-containing protein [Verrucomicrobiae bacterium]
MIQEDAMCKEKHMRIIALNAVLVMVAIGAGFADMRGEEEIRYPIGTSNPYTRDGYASEMGMGQERNLYDALANYQIGVRQDDVEAQHRLGYIFETIGDVSMQVQAAHMYARASGRGHSNATYRLGLLYKNGRGVSPSWAWALRCFTEASTQGHVRAVSSIGESYRYGRGVEEDYDKAFALFTSAAGKEDAPAMEHLGLMYMYGKGVKENTFKALYWNYKAYIAGRVSSERLFEKLFAPPRVTYREVYRQLMEEEGVTGLAVRTGDTTNDVIARFGKPGMRRGELIVNGVGNGESSYTYIPYGTVIFVSGIVVRSSILVTTNELQNLKKGGVWRGNWEWRIPPSITGTNARLWALATSALLAEYNKNSHHLLGTQFKNEENSYVKAWNMYQWWGVGNREDLLDKLYWIEQEGHRREFDEIAECLEQENAGSNVISRLRSIGIPEQRIEVARNEYERLAGKSLLGWDYSRYVSLCRWGYLVGYLSEEEAWGRIMPVARLLQETFDSWADLGENYLTGRRFWSAKQTEQRGDGFQVAYEELLKSNQSPWVQLPWNLDLTGGVTSALPLRF